MKDTAFVTRVDRKSRVVLSSKANFLSYVGIRSSPHTATEGIKLSEEYGAGNRQNDGGGSGQCRPGQLLESHDHDAVKHPNFSTNGF